ncbi:MAG: translation elongation factor Ts [Planctomycetota bacterium]
MSIDASLVKELREKTGCPMMDCKRALVEAEGNLETAVEILRKHGHESATKRKDRVTAEGVVAGHANDEGTRAALVELLCETDFVARNEEFSALAKALAAHLTTLETAPTGPEALLSGPMETKMQEVQGALKENIRIGRFERLDAGGGEHVDHYIHFNGKIGVAVLMQLSDPAVASQPAVRDLLKDLCMQIAFSAPLGISREDIPADQVEKERALLAELDEVKAKPEKIQPKIIEGKLGKFFKENALLEQEYVKEKKVSIAKVLQRVGSEGGGTLAVKRFVRMEVGKG